MGNRLQNPIPHIQAAKHGGQLRYSFHVLRRMIERGFSTEMIEAVLDGPDIEVLENELGQPNPTCLVLGWDVTRRPYHIVIAHAKMIIVSTYIPTAPKWINPRSRGGDDDRQKNK